MLLMIAIFTVRSRFGIGKRVKWSRRNVIIWGLFNVALLIYTLSITIANDALTSNYSAVTGVFNYFVMVVFFSIVLESFFENEEEFCNVLIIATLLQSIIVIASLSSNVRLALESVQIGDFDRYVNRVIGLGITGATGSIYLFTGLIANAYMILFKKSNWKYMFSLLTIFVSIMLVARTGFYAASVLLIFIFIYGSGNIDKKIKQNLMIIISSIVIGVVAFIAISITEADGDLIRYTLGRLDEIFAGTESKTLITISNMNIPSLSVETFFGTGVRKGYTSSGELIWHDSGYIQRYMSIGLLMAVLSYFSLIFYCAGLIKKITGSRKRRFFILVLMLMLVIELKEPFIFTLSYPFVFLIILRLTIKAQQNKI